MPFDIGIDDPRADDVGALLATHLAFSRGVTPPEYSFALDVDQLIDPAVTFFSARADGRLVGVAALKRLDETHAELKSMHTLEPDRGRGVGRSLVSHILTFAREHGYRDVSLETGATDEFLPARHLYTTLGFRPCQPFGGYRASSYNAFMRISIEPCPAAVPEDVATFGRVVADRLHATLGDQLIGAYFVGSVALGGYVAGESDIDIVAASEGGLAVDVKLAVADALLDVVAGCPARGLEFTLYRFDVATNPPEGTDFEVNVNGGPRMARSFKVDPSAEPRFWYVLDRAIAHRFGIEIVGPRAADVFADGSRRTLLAMMLESMRWHREHERATLYSVLNGCRAWRFAAENHLGSKLEGASWARARWPNPALIDAAVDLRHGRPADLEAGEVDVFLAHVESEIATAE